MDHNRGQGPQGDTQALIISKSHINCDKFNGEAFNLMKVFSHREITFLCHGHLNTELSRASTSSKDKQLQ
jgi:hypothetical protein